jgi:protein TonB
MFESATFHSNGILHDKTPKWMLLTLAVNTTLVLALIALPLIYPHSLPTRLLSKALYAPAPPPAITHLITRSNPALSQQSYSDPFQAPTRPPIGIDRTQDPGPPPGPISDLSTGDTPGAPEATNPILRSTTPPPVVHQPQPQKIHISNLSPSQLLYKTTPTYPAMAIATRTQGTVVLAATISRTGAIENLRVVSGPGMLQQSAIEAVQKWRYRPYLLNNQPVEVETTINVVFSLTSQ